MSPSRRRILLLGAALLAGVLCVLLQLGWLMLGQGETWLRRSYENRWAFRDVPSRRGSILDRKGLEMVRDEPSSALLLHYWAFRRYHPVGAAVHAANLVAEARSSVLRYDLRYGPSQARPALRACLQLPVSCLEAETFGQAAARDLLFYLGSLLHSLSNGSRGRIRQELRRAASDRGGRPGLRVYEALALDAEALEGVFAAYLGELEEMAERLRPLGRELWQELGQAQDRWHEGEEGSEGRVRSEEVPRALCRRLGHELATFIARKKERHPGFLVQPSVARVQGLISSPAGRPLDWSSLKPLLGRVTGDWGEQDKGRRQQLLDELAPSLEQLAAADRGLSPELRQSLRRRLQRTVSYHLRSRGRTGRSGFEAEGDLQLCGAAGLQLLQRGRRRRQEQGLWSSFDVTPGVDLRLSFDLRLQDLLEKAVDDALESLPKTTVAAMAVIDPRSGEVLALVSRPRRADRGPDDRQKAEPALVWWGPGDIGSLAKPFVLLEHLDAERKGRQHRTHEDFEVCTGRLTGPGRRRLVCDHSHQDQARDAVFALGESCNIFFYQAAEGLGSNGLEAAYLRFGLGRQSPAYQPWVPGIPRQQYPDPTISLRRDLQRRAIGYGIQANVLQVARAYAGIATGRLPWLTCLAGESLQADGLPLGVHPQDLEVVRDGLEYCVRQGTAADVAGLKSFAVLAKTGTAEVTKKLRQNNGWLAGYLSREKPTLAFAAVAYLVPDKNYGAAVAGPMFTRFLEGLAANRELREEYL